MTLIRDKKHRCCNENLIEELEHENFTKRKSQSRIAIIQMDSEKHLHC